MPTNRRRRYLYQAVRLRQPRRLSIPGRAVFRAPRPRTWLPRGLPVGIGAQVYRRQRPPLGRPIGWTARTVLSVLRNVNQVRKHPLKTIFRRVLRRFGQGNVCQQRSARREHMFSMGVAGRRWGSGGPNMKKAKRSEDSNASCRR